MTSRPTLADVFVARRRLASRIHDTPVVRSAWLSGLAGADVYLKLESLQRTGSFKFRGALNAVLELTRIGARGPLVTASAGNHGHALAAAALDAGLPLIVFTRRTAPATKLDAIRRLGADLRAVADTYDEAERLAKAHAAATGAAWISPYSNPWVIAGAATIALEVLEAVPHVGCLGVPLGGGGLISGIALAVKAAASGVRVVGAEVEASPAFTTSLRKGRVTEIGVGDTIADGLAGNLDPDTITFDLVRELVDEVLLVPEQDLRLAVRGLAAHERLVTEGAGAAAVGALLAGRLRADHRPLALVISGGNIDTSVLARLLA